MLKPAEDVAMMSTKKSRTCLQGHRPGDKIPTRLAAPGPLKKPTKPINEPRAQTPLPEGGARLTRTGQGQRQMGLGLVTSHLVATGWC